VKRIVKNALMSEFNAEVLATDSAAAAISLIEHENIPFNIIVSRNKLDEEASALTLLNYNYDRTPSIPIIVLGDVEFSGSNYIKTADRFRTEEIFRHIIDLLNISKEELAEIKLPEYIPVPIEIFIRSKLTICDVYIKISKKHDPDQYVKIMHTNHEINHEHITRYQQKEVTHLYVKKADRNKFFDSMIEQSVAILEKQDLPSNVIVDVAAEHYGISQNLITQMGITPHCVKLVNSSVKAIAKVVQGHTSLGPLLKLLLNNRGSYAYRHCHLITLFSHRVLNIVDWCDEKQFDQNFEKISFVAFLHDITLPEDQLVQINNKLDLYKLNLSKEKKDLVLNHANTISTIVQTFPKAPSGADIFLRQHHGVSNGIGFADTFVSNLSIHAILFIVVEDFAHHLLNFKENKLTMSEIFIKLYQRYPLPSYRKIVDALKTMIVGGM